MADKDKPSKDKSKAKKDKSAKQEAAKRAAAAAAAAESAVTNGASDATPATRGDSNDHGATKGNVEVSEPKLTDKPSYDYGDGVDGGKEGVGERDPALDDVGGGSFAADNSSHYEGKAGKDDPADDPKGATSEKLDLDEDGDRLPWLESRDYDESEHGGDGTRILGLIIFGLLALALLLGVVWWFSRGSSDKEATGDGSTIAAPEGNYKERPENPGGKTFEGTGDTSFAVGEGQQREGRVGDGAGSNPGGGSDARPGAGSGAGAGAGASGAGAAGAAGAGANGAGAAGASGSGADDAGASGGGINVQVGAYSSRAAAEAGWNKLTRQTNKLNGVQHRIVEGNADIGKVYRLQALPGNASAAKQLCDSLRRDGIACQVKR